jgi:hypothetical protein
MKLKETYKINEPTLLEQGNFRSRLFQDKAREVADWDRKINTKVSELMQLVFRRAVSGEELNILRAEMNSDAEDFDVLALQKKANKDAKSGLFAKNFPRQVAQALERSIKKGDFKF